MGGTTEAGSYESQVVELADGRLMLNARMQQRGQGYRGISYSDDGGKNWSGIRHDEELPDPICQGSLIRYPHAGDVNSARALLLFSNPAVRNKPGIDKNNQRRRLAIKLSRDEGATWPVERILHHGPSAYSCLAACPDGTLACLYEAGNSNYRETISFARFSLDWLLQGSSSPLSSDPIPE